MKKLKKLALILGGVLIVVGIAAEVTFKSEVDEVLRLEQDFEAALTEVYPTVRYQLRREFDAVVHANDTFHDFVNKKGHPFDLPRTPYSAPGNQRSFTQGGILNGPTQLSRTIVMNMPDPKADFSKLPISQHIKVVRLEVTFAVDWDKFPGPRKIVFLDDGTDANQVFLDLLKPELSEREIEFEVKNK